MRGNIASMKNLTWKTVAPCMFPSVPYSLADGEGSRGLLDIGISRVTGSAIFLKSIIVKIVVQNEEGNLPRIP